MSITRLGLGGYPVRKKPEKLFEPPDIGFEPDNVPADAGFTDVQASPTGTSETVEGVEGTIFTDIIPTSEDDDAG